MTPLIYLGRIYDQPLISHEGDLYVENNIINTYTTKQVQASISKYIDTRYETQPYQIFNNKVNRNIVKKIVLDNLFEM